MRSITILLLLVYTSINGGETTIRMDDIAPPWYCAPSKLDILESAVSYQESRHGTITVTPQSIKEGAVGMLQIRKGMVDYLNQINGYRKYTYADRNNPIKAKEMFREFQTRFNPEFDIDYGCHIWNAGQNRVRERWHLTSKYRKEVWKYINTIKQ